MMPSTETTLQRLLRHRVFQSRVAGIRQHNLYEIFSCSGPSHYDTANTMKHALKLANKTAHQQPGTIVSIWSPLRGHVYQAVVHDGQYKVLHGAQSCGAQSCGNAAKTSTGEPLKEPA